MRYVLSLVASSALFASTAFAECMPGKYAGAAQEAGQEPFPVLVTIDCAQGAVTGQVESVFGVVPISRGETSEGHWRLEAAFDGQPLSLEATQSEQEWRGAYRLGASEGQLLLHRDDSASFADLSSEAPARTDISVDEWRSDLAALARELPARHADAFHTIDARSWNAAVAALHQRLPSLSGMEAPVAFRELVARIGDGHTAVQLPDSRRLPIRLFWFGNDLRVIAVSGAYPDLLGARVLRVGDEPVQSARRRVARLLARENRWSELAATPYLLRREDVLRYFHLAQSGAGVSLRVRLDGGETRDITLAYDAGAQLVYVGGAVPIWRQRQDESLWWETLPGGALYVNFRGYDQLRTKSAQLFSEIDRLQPQRVVLDMRDNSGGDFTVFRESILAAIRHRAWLNHGDRLYVIIGREMFSAAMTNAADMRLQTNATLVGEPIGERPNSFQEVRSFSLPNSHLRVGVSTRYYEAMPGAGNPDAIAPQVQKPPTWRLFREGRDDAMEWIEQRGYSPAG